MFCVLFARCMDCKAGFVTEEELRKHVCNIKKTDRPTHKNGVKQGLCSIKLI